MVGTNRSAWCEHSYQCITQTASVNNVPVEGYRVKTVRKCYKIFIFSSDSLQSWNAVLEQLGC